MKEDTIFGFSRSGLQGVAIFWAIILVFAFIFTGFVWISITVPFGFPIVIGLIILIGLIVMSLIVYDGSK